MVVADLTWFRRDVLVGPPGDREPRRGDGARAISLLGPDGPIPLQPLGRALEHERLDAPRHYPDQDEVDVVRVAFQAPALGGLGVALLEPIERQRASVEGGARAAERSLDNGLLALTVGPGRDHRAGRSPDGPAVPLAARPRVRRRCGRHVHLGAARAGSRASAGRAGGGARVGAGPVVAALEVRGRLGCANGWVDVRLVVTLHAGSPALRCTRPAG